MNCSAVKAAVLAQYPKLRDVSIREAPPHSAYFSYRNGVMNGCIHFETHGSIYVGAFALSDEWLVGHICQQLAEAGVKK